MPDPFGIKWKVSYQFEIENKKIQWVKGKIKTGIDPKTDFLLISNNAGYYIEDLKDYHGTIILDGSNTKRSIEKLSKEKIGPDSKLIVLYETGSRTFSM